MTEKVIGYVLLLIGLVLILVSAINIYQVFTGQNQPFALIHSSGLSMDLKQGQPVQIMPAKDIDQITNLTTTYLLFTFLVSVGFKISTLGNQLLRPCPSKL